MTKFQKMFYDIKNTWDCKTKRGRCSVKTPPEGKEYNTTRLV